MYFSDHVIVQNLVAWNDRTESVTASTRRVFGELIVGEKPLTNPDPAAVAQAMLRGVKIMGLTALPWSDAARSLRARVAFLRAQFPDAGWPDLTDEALSGRLNEWLTPWLAGMTRRTHLERLNLLAATKALIPADLLARLDVLAPGRIAIPSGATAAIDYANEGGPTVRVRIQEMFGLARTPVIADGRIKLRIEFLSPAGRPLAITQSLESFWTNIYPQVRAEMRRRYPKHSWPDDPVNTQPLAPRRIR
jgi:ATP-dependent helicase HrpB